MAEWFELLETLAKIPAPSHHEEKRAEFCKSWLESRGAQNVYIDEALNVVYPIGDVSGELVVIMAHSDVVFPDTEELPFYVENGRIYCPGIGDDTAHVVALLLTAEHIIKNGLTPKRGGVLLAVNSCEEGLGNLKGCRRIMADYGDRVKEFITLDSCVGVIHDKTVGSRRYKIEVETEGGHSYQAFGNKNAIAVLADLISRLYKIEVPKIGKTTYNVGVIEGGTSVNTIAQRAEALFEFRSDEREGLEIMQRAFDKAIEETDGSVTVTLVGDRPCAGEVDAAKLEALGKRVERAVKKYFDIEVKYSPGSTDCNIPSSMGIPAVCVGLVRTKGAHKREEYMEYDSMVPGIEAAKEIIGYYFE